MSHAYSQQQRFHHVTMSRNSRHSGHKRFDQSDAAAAQNLKRLFEARRHSDKRIPTIADLADLYGCSRSMMSQYINGITAIGPVATMRLAHILRVPPTEIRPDFEFAATADDLPPEAVTVAVDYLGLDKDSQAIVRALIDRLQSAQ